MTDTLQELRDPALWTSLRRAYPAGACWYHVVHRMVAQIIFEIGTRLEEAKSQLSAAFSIRKRGRNARLRIGVSNKSVNIPIIVSDFSIVFGGKDVILNHSGAVMEIVDLVVGELEACERNYCDRAED